MGRAGERIAAWWLLGQGLEVRGRNVVVGDGEVDLIARDGGTTVVIEVRTITGDGDPLDAVGTSKRRRVTSLAGRVGAGRVDFLGVALRPDAVELHWLPG